MSGRHRHGIQSSVHVNGHPIHPMLIPLPVAAFIGLVLTDLAWLQTADPFWARASWWLLAAGIATGLLAGAVGAIDYLTIARVRQLPSGRWHAIGNVIALVLAGVNLAIRWDDPRAIEGAPFILTLMVFALLGITAWLGGELSYRHRIGVAVPDANEDDSRTTGA